MLCLLVKGAKITYSYGMKIFSANAELQARILNRFIKYVKIWSESSAQNAEKGVIPSTPCQKQFAKTLASDLKACGLKNVSVNADCYVYGILPATKGMEDVPAFCLISHLDTVDEVSGKDVKPIIHAAFDGTRIDLKDGVSLDVQDDAYLAMAATHRDTIITADGTTLLGADDKAGITEIVTALEYIKEHKEFKHGAIEVLFSPDEETGHGMDKVPIDLLKSTFAYTVDGGHAGQLEIECFNAYSAKVKFVGKATHTGDARKGGMINASCAAAKFIDNVPLTERPETTDGYQGFYAVMGFEGAIEEASVFLLLRDFTEQGMNDRIEKVKRIARASADSFGATVDIEFTCQYKNMRSALDASPFVVKNLEEAYKSAGLAIEYCPIRGGTDGSRLTEMGIPTPNIFTGGHNFHSKREWASLWQMSAAVDVLVNLAAVVVLKNKK